MQTGAIGAQFRHMGDHLGGVKKDRFCLFLLLKKDTMLETENLKVTTRITVLNYDSYNQQKTKIHHDEETQKGTPK